MKNKTLFLFALLFGCFVPVLSAQVQVAPFLNSRVQFFNVGVPCSGCLLDTFAAGTTNTLATYSESTGTTPNANPVVLASDGSAVVYLTSAAYKLRLRTAAGVTIWTQDSVTWNNLATTLSSLTLTGNATINSSTAATNVANQSGPTFGFCGNYWTGAASASDCWNISDVLGSGSNPTSTLTLTHSGSSGTPLFSVPALSASSVSVSGAEASQTDNQVLQVNKFATGGTGTVGSPWTSASGSGGLFEAITAAGTADGGNARLHMPAGFYSITTCVNATANVATGQGNSPPPTPMIIDGDGPGKTVLVGSTLGCMIDFTGRTFTMTELTMIQGAANKSTLGILQGRATNNTSSFPAGNTLKHVVITLATNSAANGSNGTIGVYNYASEGTHYTNNSVTADIPYVATSNNIFSIASAYQTQNTSIRFISQNVFEDGSCTTSLNTGACILLQGHAANNSIVRVAGECSVGITAPFLIIKAPTAPDNGSDPLAGLKIENAQPECATSGRLMVDEQILAAPKIHGTLTNLAATPIITLVGANGQLIDPIIDLQAGNGAIVEPLVSDAGAGSAGISGGLIFLHSQQTIALTNASSGCAGVIYVSSYNSPSITCNNIAGNFKGLEIAPDVNILQGTGTNTFAANTSHVFTIGGANQLVINSLYNTLSKTLAITETTPSAAAGGFGTIYADSTSHTLKSALNGGTYFDIPQVIKATSAAFATATTAGTCVQSTTAVTGATTAMAVTISPVSTPGVGAVWSAFVSSAGNVTINECAVAASAGGSIAFNIRVTP